MPTSMWDVFELCIPPALGDPGKQRISPKSDPKRNSVPKGYILKPIEEWIEKSDALFEKDGPLYALKQISALKPFQHLVGATEGDVVSLTSAYIEPSLQHACDVVVEQRLYCYHERTEDNTRTDLCWRAESLNSGLGETIAVFEWKRRGAISSGDWRGAGCKDQADFLLKQTQRIGIENLGRQSFRGASDSLFKADARHGMCQISSYALNRDTRYVILADWENWFLCDFAWMNSRTSTLGEMVKGTMISRTDSRLMRALLGFLIEAAQAKGIPLKASATNRGVVAFELLAPSQEYNNIGSTKRTRPDYLEDSEEERLQKR